MEQSPREAELTAQLEKLEKAYEALSAQLDLARAEIGRLEIENKLLREKVDKLVRRIFGKSSEKLDPAQLELLFESAEPNAEPNAAAITPEAPCTSPGADTWNAPLPPHRPARAARPRKPRLPEHLPVEEHIIEPEEVIAEPEAWRRIGEEVNEQLDYHPARFTRRRTVRPKYVRKGDMETPPVIAPLPPSLQDACIASPSLIAAIITYKFCDHLPLYRQEQIFMTRNGVYLPRQTMSRWMALAAFWLRPLYEEIKTTVLDGHCVQVDETPIEYLSPGHGSTMQGYLWTVHRPGFDTFFSWHTSRAATCLETIIPPDWWGLMQCDCYSGYPAFVKGRSLVSDAIIVLAGCMAHARRGFVEALPQATSNCAFILRQMQHLYAIEERLRQQNASPALRQQVRHAESRPIMQRIHRWCTRLTERHVYLPKSNMGKALSYLLGNWDQLSRFLEDGRLEVDNNLVENAIRPTAIGKKNWLFIGNEASGETSAILYTIIESARRRGLDPFEYLRDALTRLPRMTTSQISELQPDTWAAARKAAAKVAA